MYIILYFRHRFQKSSFSPIHTRNITERQFKRVLKPFWKPHFSSAFSTVLVRTTGGKVSKIMRLQTKTYWCGWGLSIGYDKEENFRGNRTPPVPPIMSSDSTWWQRSISKIISHNSYHVVLFPLAQAVVLACSASGLSIFWIFNPSP